MGLALRGPSADWRVAAASVAGTWHVRNQKSCQDWHAVGLAKGWKQERVLVAAVSDGAGSAKRSEVGAMIACGYFVALARTFVFQNRKIEQFDRARARNWIRDIQHRIEETARRDGCAPRDYACTLLAAIVGGSAAAILQVGDGATVVRDSHDSSVWRVVHRPQHGEYANTTNFVTDPRAPDIVDLNIIKSRINELAMFTDGMDRLLLHWPEATAFAPFFDSMFPALRALRRPSRKLDRKLSADLERYLQSPAVNRRTDDDKTLLLATRCAPVPAPGSGTQRSEEAWRRE